MGRERGATAAFLQQGMFEQLWGYAITAKPSANLYILLQVRPMPQRLCKASTS